MLGGSISIWPVFLFCLTQGVTSSSPPLVPAHSSPLRGAWGSAPLGPSVWASSYIRMVSGLHTHLPTKVHHPHPEASCFPEPHSSLQFPSKGGSRHHHFVFSQGGRLAACQSLALGSQVLTKQRPEQEGGARGSTGARRLPCPLPCTPTSRDELRAAGAAVADNSKLLLALLGRQWVTR